MIRSLARPGQLSRSDASRIYQKIAEILKLDPEYVAEQVADHYLANRVEIDDKTVNMFCQEFLNTL